MAHALDASGLTYAVDGEEWNKTGLDFYIVSLDVYIEVKSGHTPRIADQMSRHPNIIAVQGKKSVRFVCLMLEQLLKK